jgi:DNA-binding CsgD family transcriptional regulator
MDGPAVRVFGRDPEFVRLSTFLDAVPRGPRALLLEGEAGVGKTTVWRWALGQATAAGFRVLSCPPAEAEAKFSHAALGDLFETIDGRDLPDLPALQRRALDVVLLRHDDEGIKLDPRVIAVAVLAYLRALAGTGPLLIGIDDVQWLDRASARVLAFCVRRLSREQVGLLLTLRTPSLAGVPLGLDRAFADGGFERLELGPLSLGALHHFLRARVGTEFSRPVLLRLHETSGGNPLYALEIAHDLVEHGLQGDTVPLPRSLRELVERRLARLPRHMQDVLLTIAALSQPTLTQVRAVAENPATVDADIERAARLGLVELKGNSIRFSHPLLASVHYQSTAPGQRRTLHRRLSATVVDVEERARHLALATTAPDRDVAAALDEAAARARARGAPEAGAALLEAASRLTPPDDQGARWTRMGDAAMSHYLAGDTDRARALWEEIERSVPSGAARASALWHLVEFRHANLSLQQQIEAMNRALEDAGDDPALRSAIHHTIALSLAWRGDARQAQPHAQSALELAEATGDATTVAIAATAAAVVRFLSGHGPSRAMIDRAVELEWATKDLPLENSPRMTRGMLLAHIGEEPKVASDDLTEVRRWAHESGLDVSLPVLLFVMADHECRVGNWERARGYATECVEAAARAEQAFRAPMGLLAMALLDARQGHLDAAHAAATEAVTIVADTAGRGVLQGRIWAVLGFIELARGDAKAADAWLRRVVQLEEDGGYDEPTVYRGDGDAIEARLELGRLDEASALTDRLEQRGRDLDRAWALAVGARCRGLVCAARGDLESAEKAIERAMLAHERFTEPFELGRTLLALGNVERRRRQKQAAREVLQRAQAIFEQLGARGWAARAVEEMQRTGAAFIGPDQLTATEERVARLIGAGRTNREIAAALFITVKAVEANLTRIYAKLDVRSRTELALRLGAVPQPVKP